MKKNQTSLPGHPNVIPFPNALSRRQSLHRMLDSLLVAFSGIGITAMLTLLLTLG